jgi:hypothetical protein
MLPPLPRCGGGAWSSLGCPTVSAFPGTTAGSARTLSFSRFARRSLALRPVHSRRSPKCDPLSEGFSHFVTSMTAPVASGWSDWPGGAFTHWKAPPLHGARRLRTFSLRPECLFAGVKRVFRLSMKPGEPLFETGPYPTHGLARSLAPQISSSLLPSMGEGLGGTLLQSALRRTDLWPLSEA